ncbi:ABC-three component system protein [Streptococcus suis]|uniref:ABC-three component system protein n=1 Tax=Streptococcus suis TaxID=1307 RepID=UPI0004146405|nr:ABC-three component system protein [Streptococcus suis]
MASSNVDQNRNATPSWSGYIHQGKVGFLVALRQLRQCIEAGVSYEEYSIRYENAEDFDIIGNGGQVLSRHQVKAYINGNEREDYSDLFNIQTRKVEDGKEKIDQKGFQIHEFDGKGNVVRVMVPSDSRFLHVIEDVPDFNLSKDDYLSKYPSRTKYTDNVSCVRLYKYNQAEDRFYCPLSQYEENDTIRDYCIAEIERILGLRSNLLKDNSSHFDQVYLKYVGSLLDHSIGQAHSESGFPEISFGEILSIIEKETPKDEVYEMKNNLTCRWEKYRCDYGGDIREEDIKRMDEINNQLLSLPKDEFYEFVRMMLPHENPDENFLELFRNAPMEDIFYVLLEKIKGFSFKAYSYLDDNEKSYRTSLISIQDRPGRIATVIKNIIDNSEFLKATFNHDFLINRDIDELHIGNRIDEFDGVPDNRYREEWNTGVQHNIFKPNMEFIGIKKVKEKNLSVPED